MLNLATLGRLELASEGVTLLSGRRKLLAVLAYLARTSRPVPRVRLAALFWPVEDEVRARRSVRQALTELRRALGQALDERDDAVGITAGSLEVDASRFEAAVSCGDYRAALDLWGGEFLSGLDDVGDEDLRAWLDAERQGLRARFGVAAEALTEEAERQGAWETARAVTARWMDAVPFDERAALVHRRLTDLAGRTEPGGAAAIPGGRALLSPDLVARETAFTTLTGLWELVCRGEPRLALIEGDEGIGKTRLMDEFLRWVGRRDPRAVLLWARAFDAERDRAGVLARHLLTPLAVAPGAAAAPPPALRRLAMLVPEIAERFPALTADAAFDHLAEAVARVLAEVAMDSPVLVAVDDVDLADSESRDLVEALFRRPVPGVLVLASALPHAVLSLFGVERGGASPTACVRITLDPLDAQQVERLVAGMAEFAPDDRRVLAERLHGESGGNPLVVVELLTSVAAQGTIAPGADGRWAIRAMSDAPLPIPSSLREAMAARFRQLTPDATRVLQAAAVLGREAEVGLVGDVVGLDSARLEEAVAQAVGHRLLRFGEGSARLEFTYEAARRAVYQEMPPLRRRDLHRRAYRMLRRRPARDSSQQAAIGHHRLRAAEIPRWRRYARWVLAASGAAVAVGAALVVRDGSGPLASPIAIAVLPFDVRGGERYAYLGEGMVDLLSADLDEMGGLRGTDPRAVLAQVAGEPRSRDPARGRAVAQRLGAGLFVLGDLVELGDRVQLAAYLYDARGRLQTVARATIQSEGEIHRAVDEIARQLLAGRHQGPAEALTRLAVATTPSVPALKAYLEGERRLRAGAFGPAVESFLAAIAADSSFALAHYRLAVAAEWDEQSALSERAAEQAARLGNRLSGHFPLLVEGLLAWRRGDAAGAELVYRSVVGHHPDDLEGWFQLGEVLFHSNPLRGRSIAEARGPWERVLALEPGNRFAVLHLARIAAAQDDAAQITALVKPVAHLEPNGDRRELELAGWRALVLRDRAEEDRVGGLLRRSNSFTSINVVWQLATFSRNLAGSERLGLVLDRWSVDGILVLAHTDLARGMRRRADRRLRAAASPHFQFALAYRAYWASFPFVPVSRSELDELRHELRGWRTGEMPIEQGPDAITLHAAAAPLLRDYLLGTLSVRAGDTATAERSAAALERAPAGTAGEDSLAQALALGVRALMAQGRGQPSGALQLLEGIPRAGRREETSQSPFHAGVLERYLRADVLRELGHDEEALAWYESLGELSPFELPFLAPAHLRRAEIYQRLGRRGEAAAQYARFIDLWKDADPELQPQVAAARTRLKDLAR